MGLDVDTLQLIQETAQEATARPPAPTMLEIPGEDPTIKRIVYDGAIQEFQVPRPGRKLTLKSLDDLVRLALNPGIAPDPEIWHDDNAVVVLLDAKNRRGLATFALEKTKTWNVLVGLKSAKLDQRALRGLIRTGLADAGISPTDLCEIISQIKFQSIESGESSITKAASSLGRSVEREVTGSKDFPDEFEVVTTVYRAGLPSDYRAQLKFSLDLDLEQQQFLTQARGDSIERAIDEAQALLHSELVSSVKGGFEELGLAALGDGRALPPIFAGCPNVS